MTKWEYRIARSQAELEGLGGAGWNVVSVVVEPGDGTHTVYLTRPAQSFRDRVTLEQKRRYYASKGKTVTEVDTL